MPCSSFICVRRMNGEWSRSKMRATIFLRGLHHGPDSIFTNLSCCLIARDYEPTVALGAAAVKPWTQSLCSRCRCSCSCAYSSYSFSLGFTSPSTFKLHPRGDTRVGKGSPFSLILMLLGLSFYIPQSNVF